MFSTDSLFRVINRCLRVDLNSAKQIDLTPHLKRLLETRPEHDTGCRR